MAWFIKKKFPGEKKKTPLFRTDTGWKPLPRGRFRWRRVTAERAFLRFWSQEQANAYIATRLSRCTGIIVACNGLVE